MTKARARREADRIKRDFGLDAWTIPAGGGCFGKGEYVVYVSDGGAKPTRVPGAGAYVPPGQH